MDRLERYESLSLSRNEVGAYIENYYSQFVRAREEEDDERLKPIVQDFVEKVIVHKEEIEGGGGEGYLTVTKIIKWPAKDYPRRSVLTSSP